MGGALFPAQAIQEALDLTAPAVPRGRRGAHRRDRSLDVPTGESCPHAGEVDPVRFAETMKETSPDRAGVLAENPRCREVDDVQAVVRTEQHVPVVEIGERHTLFVERVQNKAQPVEDLIFETVSRPLPQRHGVDPPGGHGEGTEESNEGRERGNTVRRDIGFRLSPDQPTTEGTADQGSARLVGLHRHPFVTEIVEEDVGLGPVAADDAPNRLDPGEAPRIEVSVHPGV